MVCNTLIEKNNDWQKLRPQKSFIKLHLTFTTTINRFAGVETFSNKYNKVFTKSLIV